MGAHREIVAVHSMMVGMGLLHTWESPLPRFFTLSKAFPRDLGRPLPLFPWPGEMGKTQYAMTRP